MDQIIPSLMPFLIVGGVLAIYFMPTMFAVMMKNKNVYAIIALNILLGWTVVFWLFALIWSLMNQRQVASNG